MVNIIEKICCHFCLCPCVDENDDGVYLSVNALSEQTQNLNGRFTDIKSSTGYLIQGFPFLCILRLGSWRVFL